MSVYIESVILDNFFITLLISLISYRALSVKRSVWRLLTASVVGTAAAVAYPLLPVHTALLVCAKLALAAALVLILFLKKTKPFPAACVFLFLTFAFGGALFCIGYVVYGDIESALRLPVTNIPTGLIIAGAFALYFPLKKTVRRFKRVLDAKAYVTNAKIDIFGQTFSGTAFMDTGNRLYDAKTDLPVIILSAKLSLKILGEEGLLQVLRGKERAFNPSARYIEIGGVSDKNRRLLVLKPDAVRFYTGQTPHIIKEVMLGLSLKKLSDAIEYDMLLHPKVFTMNNE